MPNVDIPTVLALLLALAVTAACVYAVAGEVDGEARPARHAVAEPPVIEAILVPSLEVNDGQGATEAWSPKRELKTAEQTVIDPSTLFELTELRAATEPAFRDAYARFDAQIKCVLDRLLAPVDTSGRIQALGLGHAHEVTQEIDLKALRREMAGAR